MEAPENNREEPQRNKQIVFIIAIYLLLTMSSHFTLESGPFNKNVIQILKNSHGGDPPVKTMLSIFSGDNYEGQWAPLGSRVSDALTRQSGKVSLRIYKYSLAERFEYELQFHFNNGPYIDEGSASLRMILSPERLYASRNGTRVKIFPLNLNPNNITKVKALYRHELIMKTVQQKIVELQEVALLLDFNESTSEFSLSFDIESQSLSVKMAIAGQESKLSSTITFAIMLFAISYLQFSAIMEMLRALFQGRESPHNYSILTVFASTMWDAVLCIVAFTQAFLNEDNLILFIMPAFILCLLFTNLELRLMLLIFQSHSQEGNMRQVLCRFNLITYGGLILMYPILIYTNLSIFFFIGISLLFVPQIYTNAVQGHRPDVSSPYYKKFLTVRFLIIIYLKCFPWNVFQLAPNYFLGIGCLLLVAFQIFLLWIQRNYGPKKILPKFLLPPVFDYDCDIVELTIAEQIECAICLMTLNSDSQQELDYSVPYKVMRAPCQHSFHGSCLIKWMQIKMQCPQCRGKLPPFE